MKTLKEISAAYLKLSKLSEQYQTALEAVSEARFDPGFEMEQVVQREKECRKSHAKLMKTLECFGLPTFHYAEHLENEIKFAWWVMNLNPDLCELMEGGKQA